MTRSIRTAIENVQLDYSNILGDFNGKNKIYNITTTKGIEFLKAIKECGQEVVSTEDLTY